MIAILRTVCEYGVIRHDMSLKKEDICQFVGEEYNPHYIREILKKYFRLIKNSKFYENKGVCIDYLFKDNPEYLTSFNERIYWKQ